MLLHAAFEVAHSRVHSGHVVVSFSVSSSGGFDQGTQIKARRGPTCFAPKDDQGDEMLQILQLPSGGSLAIPKRQVR